MSQSTPATIESLRAKFLSIINRPAPSPQPQVKVTQEPKGEEGLVVEKVLVQTEEEEWAPVFLVKKPSSRPLPVLFLLHGTSRSNSFLWDLGLFQRFAEQGYLVVGMDCRYHGERLLVEEQGSLERYHDALTQSYKKQGRLSPTKPLNPFIYDNVWDLMRVIDYLTTRPDVDSNRIASTGISLGGMHTWFLMIADARVSVGAPLIGVQGFQWAVDHGVWQARVDTIRPVFDYAALATGTGVTDAAVVKSVWDTICPGLLDRFDSPYSLPLLAPRPMLICNGEDDPRCPAEGVRAAVNKAGEKYHELGANDHLDLYLAPGVGHEVTEDMWEKVEKFLSLHLQLQTGSSRI